MKVHREESQVKNN